MTFEEMPKALANLSAKMDMLLAAQAQAAKPFGGFISRKEAAELLHVTLPTIHRWINEGQLQSYHVGKRTLLKRDEVMQAAKPVNFKIGGVKC